MADKGSSLASVDAAIVPLERVHLADLEAGAARFDGWLRSVSGGYVTLERLRTAAQATPGLGNIIAAIEVCGDLATLIDQRHVSPRSEAERLEQRLNWANLAINLIGVSPLPPGTTAARMTLRPMLARVRQAVRQGEKDLASATVALIAGHFSATLMGELSVFAEQAKARLPELLNEAAQEAETRLTQLADGLSALAAGRLTDPNERGAAARRQAKRGSSGGSSRGSTRGSLSVLLHDPAAVLPDLFGAVDAVHQAAEASLKAAGAQLVVTLLPQEAKAAIGRFAAEIRASIPRVQAGLRGLASEEAGTVMSMLTLLIRAIQAYERKKHPVSATLHPDRPSQVRLKARGQPVTSVSRQAKPRKPGASPCKGCEIGQPANGTAGSIGFALGEESLTHTDFVLPGLVPLAWARTYRSNFGAHDEAGPLGPRWTTPYHAAFEARGDALVYHDAAGRSLTYPALRPGEPHHDAIESCTLTREAGESGERIRLVRGETLTETYERHGARYRLTRLEDRSGNAVTLTWAEGRLATIAVAGAVAAVTHDEAGRIVQVARVDELGEADASGGANEAEEARLPLARYRYDEAGDLVEASDEHGAAWHYAYAQHLVTRYTDRTGRGMNLEWDGTHVDAKAVREWADDGTFDTRLTWHERLRLTFVTDALGRTTQQYYDLDGYVYRIVYPERTEEWFFRDAAKHVTWHVLPDGTEEAFTWDAAGRLSEHTAPDGRTAYYVYDGHGNLIGVQDPEGHRWERRYDSRGRVTEALDPLGRVTQYDYDRAGRPVAITDPKGGTATLAWRADGQLASYTDCSGQRATWAYDARGRLIEARNAAGEATRYGYAQGQLAWVTRPAGQRDTYTRDAEGRLLEHVDALSRVTRYHYTAAGLVSKRTNALGDTLEYAWNRLGQLVGLRNENGRAYRFGYDEAGRLSDETDFDGRETRYYRAADSGRVTHRLAGGVMQAFEYDAMGRLASRRGWAAQFTDGGRVFLAPQGEVKVEREAFQYDGLGRLLQAENGPSRVRRTYDALGQLTSEQLQMKIDDTQHAFVWRHAYDEVGARVSTTRPDGRRLDWLTYGAGHVHGLALDGRTVASFERDAAHRETVRELGNGLRQLTQYDAAGRLARQTLQGTGGKVAQRQYEYDALGQLTQRTELGRTPLLYAYDALGRLTQAQSSLGVETFAFDPASNLVEVPPGNVQGDAPPGDATGPGGLAGVRGAPLLDNLLREYAGTQYTYDEHGQLKERRRNGARTQFGWNCWGRLVTARDRHMEARYTYDALGRRIAKLTEPREPFMPDAGSGWWECERARLKRERGYGFTLYGWDGDTLAYETSWERRETTHYVYEPGGFTPLVQARGPAVLGDEAEGAAEEGGAEGAAAHPARATLAYYHCDQLGTPQELTDEAGELAWSARYRAWGEAQEAQGVISEAARRAGITNPLRFAGQYLDRETGLHYNRHRYYDPSAGRFISKDPIGLVGGLNAYQYAPNPVQWIDPLGLIKLGYDKGRKTWNTPSGLSYGQGSAQGNRVKHVLEHESPNPSKKTHSVFCTCKKGESLDLVDEAWVQRGQPLANDPGTYVVPMGRSVGTAKETNIKIITRPGTSEVITAYPVP